MQMRIRPNNHIEPVAYAEGSFDGRDAFVTKQQDGVIPFGGLLCCPGSSYSVEVGVDGRSCSYYDHQSLTPHDGSGKAWYIKDVESGEIWSPFPYPTNQKADEYEACYSPGQMNVYSQRNKIACTLTIATIPDLPCEVWLVKLCNLSAQGRMLSFTTYAEPCTGPLFETRRFDNGKVMLLRQPLEALSDPATEEADADLVVFQASTLTPSKHQVEKSVFIGERGSFANPAQVVDEDQDDPDEIAGQAITSMTVQIELPIEGEAEFGFVFGAAPSAEKAFEIACRFTTIKPVVDAVRKSNWHWKNLRSQLQVNTPDPTLNALINTWLPYEAYAEWVCERNATPYVSPNHIADDLRRIYPFTATAPGLARAAIIDFASRLSVIGAYYVSEELAVTIPPDEQLWLALCTAGYVTETGDTGILAESIPLRDGPRLTLREHCERAIRMCLHSGKGQSNLTDQVIKSWESVTGEKQEFGLYLRETGEGKEADSSEKQNTSERLRYLQSICPTFADSCASSGFGSSSYDGGPSFCELYTFLTENVLGMTASPEGLVLNPRLPRAWNECAITRRFRGDTYQIQIMRAEGLIKNRPSMLVDGEPVDGVLIPHSGDGREHVITLWETHPTHQAGTMPHLQIFPSS